MVQFHVLLFISFFPGQFIWPELSPIYTKCTAATNHETKCIAVKVFTEHIRSNDSIHDNN